jgi:hypothetical protein
VSEPPLTVGVLGAMVASVKKAVDPRKVVGIWAVPRFRRDGTVEEWGILGVVTAPCGLADSGRL